MNKKKKSNWAPPNNAYEYFSAASDKDFKAKHPVGYFFLVILGTAALILPCVIYTAYVISLHTEENGWAILGWIGSFIIGIGLFNLTAIIIKQYLGHWVSVFSFALGALLVFISLINI